jgi:hypothetical protein
VGNLFGPPDVTEVLPRLSNGDLIPKEWLNPDAVLGVPGLLLPVLDVPDDFKPRLSHRIFHIEDGANIAKETLGSGATTLSIMAVAVLLAFTAWTPRAGETVPSLELPPIVVAGPPARSFTPGPPRSTFSRSPSFFTTADFQDGPWGDTHQLLFEYSTLSGRRRGPALSRVGIQ